MPHDPLASEAAGLPPGAPPPLCLIVSGSIDRAAALAGLLRSGGADTTVTHSAAGAMDSLQARAPAFLFADVLLPDMETERFLKSAASLRPDTLRILLGREEQKRNAMQALIAGLVHRFVLIPWEDAGILTLLREGRLLQQELLTSVKEAGVQTFTSIPSPPAFHLRLSSLLRRAESSVNDIVQAIEASPALVAQMLRVANSVFYGARQPITTVAEAIMFVGTEYMISLVMAIEAFSAVCRQSKNLREPAIELLWNKAVRRAALAKKLAEQWEPPLSGAFAHTAALLMDIGYVVRICREPDRYHALLEASHTQGCTPHELESSFFAATHDLLGAALLRFWNTPEEIVDVIARHHGPASGNQFILVAQMADILESGSTRVPHDIQLDPQIPLWKDRLQDVLFPQRPAPLSG